MPNMPKFIRLKQIARMLGCSLSSAIRYTKLPDFPAPFYIGSIKMWDEDEFTKWVMSRKCAR
jgi:predicted DNA-binding transcriptional regulator AlpA